MVGSSAHRAMLLHGLRFDIDANPNSVLWARRYIPQDSVSGPLRGSRAISERICNEMEALVTEIYGGCTAPAVDRTTFRTDTHREVRTLFRGRLGSAFIPAHDGPIVFRSADQIELWMSDQTSDSDRHVLRLMRETTLRALEVARCVSLHAAAVTLRDRGILIVGPSGAGKTSLLVAFLLAGSAFVCNDRAILTPDARDVLTLPLPVRVGVGTAVSVPQLLELIKVGRFHRRQEIAWDCISGASGTETDHWRSGRKFELSPVELCDTFRCPYVTNAPIHAIIVPSISRHPCAPHLEPIATSDAMRILGTECCTPNDPTWKEPWVEPRPEEPNPAVTLAALTNRIPTFRLSFGTDWCQVLPSFVQSWSM